MAGGANASLKVTVEVMEEGDATPMSTTVQTWNGLDRLAVLVLEELLMSMFSSTAELGYTAEIAKGRSTKEEVAFAKSTVDKIRGKSGK